jgi:hypothetical protein
MVGASYCKLYSNRGTPNLSITIMNGTNRDLTYMSRFCQSKQLANQTYLRLFSIPINKLCYLGFLTESSSYGSNMTINILG